jgi:hypothetical protein
MPEGIGKTLPIFCEIEIKTLIIKEEGPARGWPL